MDDVLREGNLPRNDIRFDQGSHWRAKIGYVLLATEQTVQDDVMRLRPPGVGIHFTRAYIPDRIANDTLADQLGLLSEASATLLPDGSLDVVCYACTSGSIVMGEERVHAELKRGNPKAKPTSLVAGVIKALRALGAKSIAVATPYLDEINRIEARYLEQAGFNVVNIEGLNVERDSDMVRISPDYLSEFAQSVDRNVGRLLLLQLRGNAFSWHRCGTRSENEQAGGGKQPGDDLGYLADGRDSR